MRNRSTDIRFPVFNGYTVRVILARDVEATGRRLGTDLKGALAGHVHEGKKVAWIVLGPKGRDEATVAHEASHAVRALLAWAGARNDNETYAYHLDYLVGRIHKFLKRTHDLQQDGIGTNGTV